MFSCYNKFKNWWKRAQGLRWVNVANHRPLYLRVTFTLFGQWKTKRSRNTSKMFGDLLAMFRDICRRLWKCGFWDKVVRLPVTVSRWKTRGRASLQSISWWCFSVFITRIICYQNARKFDAPVLCAVKFWLAMWNVTMKPSMVTDYVLSTGRLNRSSMRWYIPKVEPSLNVSLSWSTTMCTVNPFKSVTNHCYLDKLWQIQ